MISSNKKYKKQIVRKKTASIIFYGIIFLISTLAYYFVNNSSAKNVLKIEAFAIDEELKIESTSCELKAEEKENKYIISLPSNQNGFVVSKYIILTEEEYNDLKLLEENGKEDTETNDKNNTIIKEKKLESSEVNKKLKNTIETEKTEQKESTATVQTKDNKTAEKSEINKNAEVQGVEEQDNTEKNHEEIKKQSIAEDETEEPNDLAEDIDKREQTNIEDEKKDSNEKEASEEETNVNKGQTEEKKEDVKKEADKNSSVNNNEGEIKETNDNKEESKKIEKTADEKAETKPRSLEEILAETKGEEIIPEEEIELGKDIVESKKLYLLAVYDKKEIKGKELYNKIISEKTEKNNIIVSGYMPANAKLKVTEVDAEAVGEKISKSVESSVKLQVAFDIKIIADAKEYEPNAFDENVKVKINGLENKKVNIWHIKDNDEVEKIELKESENEPVFETTTFSIYGIEVLEDANDAKDEIPSEDEPIDNQEPDSNINEEPAKEIKAAPPLRAAAPNIADSTLEIDDYTSDYYYYKGKNYTSDISGTYTEIYSDSNLVKVNIFYHGFANGETDPEKKGRISLTETDDIVKNIRCAPVDSSGNVTIELMENPFMDKPTGYGFGGWTTDLGTVTQNSQTLTYSLTVPVTGETTVNLYANWIEAKVVYVNQVDGNDNLNDGLSENSPVGSWEKACELLYNSSTNRNDRERNIIVVTGNMDSSINYTKQVIGQARNVGTATYTRSQTITSGNRYIISTGQGANSYALAANGTSLTREQLTSTYEPSESTQWTITASGNGYTIRDSQGRYLSYSGGLVLNNTATVWTFSSNRFRNSSNSRYLRYTNNAWTATNSTSGATIYLLTYNFTQTGTEVINTPATSFSTNRYYNTGSGNTSFALTVTSLYNHNDYRNNAVITLPENSNGDWQVYNDFQMDFINIYTGGYTSNTNGDTFTTSYAFLYGNSNNVRIGRGMICANNATFANVIGASQSTGSQNSNNNAYKLIVESGKYSEVIGFNYTGTQNYYGTVYLTLGNDIDRVAVNNNNLLIYYASTINIGGGVNGKSNVDDMAFLINVKSGSIGTPYFDEKGKNDNNSAYSGIYVGGWGTSNTSNRDISDRYCIVEGGKLSNIVGGLKTVSGTTVKTRVFVKGGELYNIVGGGRTYANLW